MKNIFISFIFCCLAIMIQSQTPVTPTFLKQSNTSSGNRLQQVVSGRDHIYYIGFANQSESIWDNVPYSNQGIFDLYIQKIDQHTGVQQWLKTLDAGPRGKIIPTYATENSAGELYVTGTFKGQITVAGRSISSVSEDMFMLKVSPDGAFQWVSKLSFPYIQRYQQSIASDEEVVFISGFGNGVFGLSAQTGDPILTYYFANTEIRSLLLHNDLLYVAGQARSTSVNGNPTVPSSGFVAVGNKFSQQDTYLKLTSSFSFIDDIAITTDGKVVLSAFVNYKNGMLPQVSTGQQSYNADFVAESGDSPNAIRHAVIRAEADLSSVNMYRVSGPIYLNGGSTALGELRSNISTSISTENFKVDLSSATGLPVRMVHANNTVVESNNVPNSAIISFAPDGTFDNSIQPVSIGYLSASTKYYTETNKNIRLYQSSVFSMDGVFLFNQKKTSTSGGSFSQQYHKGLNSAPSDVYVSAFAEGVTDFFGNVSNREPGKGTRFITRQNTVNQNVWTAKFENVSGDTKRTAYNGSAFCTTDLSDNIFAIANLAAPSSQFYDAAGNTMTYTTSGSGFSKAIVKISPAGNLLWSKQFTSQASFSLSAASAPDGSLYLTGVADADITITGSVITFTQPSVFVIKLDSAGNVVFAKVFNTADASGVIPAVQNNSSLTLFIEAIASGPFFTFDNFIVNDNQGFNNIMVTLDVAGNVTAAKNFYENGVSYSYSWINDAIFYNGDFILSGNYYRDVNQDYINLSGQSFAPYFPGEQYIPMFARISSAGAVKWEKPFFASNNNTGNYTNFNLDKEGNIYMYSSVKDKLVIDNIEYQFDEVEGEKAVTKLNEGGDVLSVKIIDKGMGTSPLISVVGQDIYYVSGFTQQDRIGSSPINDKGGSNLYVATFGYPETLAVSEKEKNLLLVDVYPNPVTDILIINTEAEIEEIKIYSLTGQLLSKQKTSRIDFKNIPSGLYLLQIKTDQGIINKKILKK